MKNHYKILIVSENQDPIRNMETILDPSSYHVEMISGIAEEVMEQIRKVKYHIVILDVDRDKKDAFTLLQEIKSFDPMVQVIAVTMCSTMDKILSALEYGAYDYLNLITKTKEDILSTIENTIDKLERWQNSIVELVSQ